MIYYANPSTDQVRDEMAAGNLGCIVTPYQGNVTFPDEWDVIADNGCFSNKWTADHWFRWLLDLPRSIRWAVCPDVFDPTGGPCHLPTLDRWREWAPKMERHGFTPAFVLQEGATPRNIPDAEVLFIGGTDPYKLGPVVWDICQAFNGERWIHMGRVNSRRRYRTARTLGCDSVDGTYIKWAPDKNLPTALSWVSDERSAPQLWESNVT